MLFRSVIETDPQPELLPADLVTLHRETRAFRLNDVHRLQILAELLVFQEGDVVIDGAPGDHQFFAGQGEAVDRSWKIINPDYLFGYQIHNWRENSIRRRC